MKKYNLVLDLPEAFYEDPRFAKYFAYFDEKANVRRTAHPTAEAFREDLAWADAVIMWTFPEFSEEDLRKAKNLKYIGKLNSTRATVEAAHLAGIELSDMRNCYSESVAELALAHILNVYRMVGRHVESMKKGTEKWVMKAPIDFDSKERVLKNAQVGIIGFGGIGQNLASFLKPFTSNISISDPYVRQEIVEKYQVQRKDIKAIFAESDIVVLCAANNTGTEKLANKELIDSLKPGALFINCGRAILVDNEALLERIRKGDIDVCLDVFEVEPLPEADELRKYDNVYLTPHRGGLLASFLQIFDQFVLDLEAVVERGEKAGWPVPLEQINSLRDYK